MNAALIAKVLLVVVFQTVVFLAAWTLMVSIARSQGRFPPELFFGITIDYGTIWIASICTLSGAVTLLATKAIVKWSTIFAGLIAWLLWLWPSFDSRLYAMPAFFTLGALILSIGSEFVIPLLRRSAKRRINGEASGHQ